MFDDEALLRSLLFARAKSSDSDLSVWPCDVYFVDGCCWYVDGCGWYVEFVEVKLSKALSKSPRADVLTSSVPFSHAFKLPKSAKSVKPSLKPVLLDTCDVEEVKFRGAPPEELRLVVF